MKTIPGIFGVLSALFFASSTASFAGTTVNFGTINQVTGPGSLDLSGTILYAVTFDGGSQTVNGVTFDQDTAPPAGFTSFGPRNVPGGWQIKPEFGPTADDDALENIYQDIRWTQNGVDQPLQANMAVTAGLQYRLQVLFYGNHDEYRGWDIRVDGVDAVDNITSTGVNTGAGPPGWSPNQGLVFTYDFTAPDNEVNVYFGQLFGLPPEGTDPNAIWQGITLERLTAPVDSDGDGLPDAWETTYFGNLSQPANGDPDSDGLTNMQEFTRSTFPNDADTDDDTLNDGAEVNTHQTNPRSADSDGDTLSDAAEINTHLTNPNDADSDDDSLSDGAEINTHGTNATRMDSDSDGFNDPTEIMNGSNPVAAASTPGPAYVSRVLGADPGEGLDFSGTFPYAFNVGTPGAPVDPSIGNATFTSDTEPGITVVAENEIPAWNNVINFGPSPGDATLAFIYQSIRWVNAGQLLVNLDNLVVGQRYKLQLMFGEECCLDRYYDIVVEGVLVLDEFNTLLAQGSIPMRSAGSAFIYEFVAGDTQLNVVLDGPGSTTGPHHNPILNGLTLESLTIPVPLEITSVTRTPTKLTLNARGTPAHAYSVDFSPNLTAWSEITDSLIPNASGTAVFEDTNPVRVNAARGFYRLRDP